MQAADRWLWPIWPTRPLWGESPCHTGDTLTQATAGEVPWSRDIARGGDELFGDIDDGALINDETGRPVTVIAARG